MVLLSSLNHVGHKTLTTIAHSESTDYRWPQETKNKIYKQYGINYEINNAETITQLHHHIMDQNLEDILHIGFLYILFLVSCGQR